MLEILQTIWMALITPNEGLTGIIFNKFGIPFIFIELTVNMLLFTTVLNIKSTRKQQIIYVVLCAIVSCISNSIIGKPYNVYINMVVCPIIVYFTFKSNFLKSIIAEIIPMIITSPLEFLFAKLCLLLFNVPYEYTFEVPLFRISITLAIYLVMYCIYILLKRLKYSISLSDTLSKHNRIIIFLNSIVGILTLGSQF